MILITVLCACGLQDEGNVQCKVMFFWGNV